MAITKYGKGKIKKVTEEKPEKGQVLRENLVQDQKEDKEKEQNEEGKKSSTATKEKEGTEEREG